MEYKMLTAAAGTLADPSYHRFPTAEAAEAFASTCAEAGIKACIYTDAETLAKAASGAFLAAVYNQLSPVKVKKFKNNTIGATRVIELLAAIEQDGPLTLVPEAPTTSSAQPDDPAATTSEGDEDMAAKKKAKKKAAAPKAKKEANGLPREGSKKAELLRLLSRKTGATKAEMLEATGWKECLGTAKQVAVAAGKKLRTEKSESGKGATRWYAE